MRMEEKLVSLRRGKNITQAELAERLDVSRQAISRWEVGSAVPSTENLKRLSELYGVSLEYLLNDSGSNDPEADKKESRPEQPENSKPRREKLWIKILVCAAACAFIFVMISAGILMSKMSGKYNNNHSNRQIMTEMQTEQIVPDAEGEIDFEW